MNTRFLKTRQLFSFQNFIKRHEKCFASCVLNKLEIKTFEKDSNYTPFKIDYSKSYATNPVSFLQPDPKASNSAPTHHDRDSPRLHSELGLNSFSTRSHTCGELRDSDVGQRVRVCGWVQHRRLKKFLTIKDSYGVLQLLLPEVADGAEEIPLESVVAAEGMVQHRPAGMQNPKMPTGDVEVVVEKLEILNLCKETLPFLTVSKLKHGEAHERLRLQHRYLDIRTDVMQSNLRFRSRLLMRMRQFLHDVHGFVEVETPTLFRRTPGGAREFLVPTSTPGQFFSLPQSPQQFKQLLMVGAVDRYFQVARCYRDEGTKSDRQPEFSQLDIEVSFTTRDGIKSLIEDLIRHALHPSDHALPPSHYDDSASPFPTMTYHEAITSYGVDKPDTRFEMRVHDVTDILGQSGSGVEVYQKAASDGARVKCIKIDEGTLLLSNAELKALLGEHEEMMTVKIKDDFTWIANSFGRHVNQAAQKELLDKMECQPKDLLLIFHGPEEVPSVALGKIRLNTAQLLNKKGHKLYDDEKLSWLWVEDFPLFLPVEEPSLDGDSGLECAHHPFTAPHPHDAHLLGAHPLLCRGLHYDLVLNGNEVGGGSIRIHDGALQRHVLEDILKVNCDQLEHLLKALDSGCPPHGGIALGLDRLVGILVGAKTIRDVIAFPKSSDVKDLMSKSPAEVAMSELEHYNISVVRDK